MQRILSTAAVCFAILLGSGCSTTGGCSSCGGCATGGCATGGCHTGGISGLFQCKHVGGKCDCGRDNVQGTCDYYAPSGAGTNVQAAVPATTMAPAKPAGTLEEVPAPKAMPKAGGTTPKVDGK